MELCEGECGEGGGGDDEEVRWQLGSLGEVIEFEFSGCVDGAVDWVELWDLGDPFGEFRD